MPCRGWAQPQIVFVRFSFEPDRFSCLGWNLLGGKFFKACCGNAKLKLRYRIGLRDDDHATRYLLHSNCLVVGLFHLVN